MASNAEHPAGATQEAAQQRVPATASRAEVRRDYLDVWLPLQKIPTTWTGGDVATCQEGRTGGQTQQGILDAVNYARDLAGLGPVVMNAVWSAKAQKAALMMQAANRLSHSPDPGWPCWSEEGAEAAGRSNLYLGRTGVPSIGGYLDDPGSNNAAVGHRSWILDPDIVRVGAGSTSRANALWVVDTQWPSSGHTEPVTWPTAGWFPRPLLPSSGRWSLSTAPADPRSLESAVVHVSVDGGPRVSADVEYTSRSRVVYAVPGLDSTVGDRRVEVTISGVELDEAPAADIGYEVRLLDPDEAAPSPTPTTSPSPSPTATPTATTPTADGRVGIRGRARPRATLRSKVPTFDPPSSVVSLQWLSDGKELRGRTGPRLKLRGRDVGHRISLQVTAVHEVDGSTEETVVVSTAKLVRR